MSSFAFRSILSFNLLLSCLLIKKVNVILIFADDQGYGDLGCFGSKKIKTPHRPDGKGRKEVYQFYVSFPSCTPSRAALLTGCYPKRVGLHQHVLFQVQPRDCIQMNTLWLIILNLWVTLRHVMVNGTWGIILKHYPDKWIRSLFRNSILQRHESSR